MHFDVKDTQLEEMLPHIQTQLNGQKLATVFSSGRTKDPRRLAHAEQVSHLLWDKWEIGVVNGDGTRSMMGIVAKHSGYAVGVGVPDSLALESDPNAQNYYKIKVLCHSRSTRIKVMTALGGALICLDGGFGSLEEALDVVKNSERYAILDNASGLYNPFIAQVQKSCERLGLPFPFIVTNKEDEFVSAINTYFNKKPKDQSALFDPFNPCSLEELRVILTKLVDLQIDPTKRAERIQLTNKNGFYDDFLHLYKDLLKTDLVSESEKRLLSRNVTFKSNTRTF